MTEEQICTHGTVCHLQLHSIPDLRAFKKLLLRPNMVCLGNLPRICVGNMPLFKRWHGYWKSAGKEDPCRYRGNPAHLLGRRVASYSAAEEL